MKVCLLVVACLLIQSSTASPSKSAPSRDANKSSKDRQVRQVCAPGYTGTPCVEINECLSSPCLNGATCVDLINAFICLCPNGYSGTTCGTLTSPPNQCPVGALTCGTGTCQVTTNPSYPYVCVCPGNTYSFNPCGSGTGVCTATTCLNGGTCLAYNAASPYCTATNAPLGYCCQCAAGYSGLTCSTGFIVTQAPMTCPNSYCNNNGMCQIVNGAYFCYCLNGWGGSTCCTPPGIGCPTNICLNGGVCFMVNNMPTCSCPVGWTGANCQLYGSSGTGTSGTGTSGTGIPASGTTLCTGMNTNLCANYGTCYQWASGYLAGQFYACFCQNGYTGTYCTTSLYGGTSQTGTGTSGGMSQCSTNVCRNGATCYIGPTNFICSCPPGFYGQLCEMYNGRKKRSFMDVISEFFPKL